LLGWVSVQASNFSEAKNASSLVQRRYIVVRMRLGDGTGSGIVIDMGASLCGKKKKTTGIIHRGPAGPCAMP